MTPVFEIVDGWYQFHVMPANTTHIAYFYENGSVYLPEDGVGYKDWTDAILAGNVHKLVRVDQLPEVPKEFAGPAEVFNCIMKATEKHDSEIKKAEA